jgi:hypothetical protein
LVGCEVSGVSTPIRRTSVRPSTAGGDLYGVPVYHPADGDHETAILQVARCGPRAILLQRGPDRPQATSTKSGAKRTKQTTRELRRCGSVLRMGTTEYLCCSVPRFDQQPGVCRPPPIRRVRPAWLPWGEKSFSALVPTHMAYSDQLTCPMEMHLGGALCQQGAELKRRWFVV